MLDGKDKRILQLLDKDGRISLTEIGEDLGISHVSVSKRLEKLKDKLLQLKPALNFRELDYRIVLIFIETHDYETREEIIDKFSDCPRAILLMRITGEYNLLAMMLAESQDVIESEAGRCAIRCQPGIRKSEVITGEAPSKPTHIQYVPPDSKMKIAPCGDNCDECMRYDEGKCLGCPATKYYKI